MREAGMRRGAFLMSGLLLAGCATAPAASNVEARRPPEKSYAKFQAENTQCLSEAGAAVAGQVRAANRRAVGKTVLGAALGAGAGAAAGARETDVKVVGNALIVPTRDGFSAGEGAGTGAAAGAAAAGLGWNGATEQSAVQQSFDAAFAACMRDAGNATPGYAAQYPAEPPRAFIPPQPTGRVRRADG